MSCSQTFYAADPFFNSLINNSISLNCLLYQNKILIPLQTKNFKFIPQTRSINRLKEIYTILLVKT